MTSDTIPATTLLSRAVAASLATGGGAEGNLTKALLADRRVATAERVYVHGVDRRRGAVSVHTTEGQVFTLTLDGAVEFQF
jgi:hypothetical protein